MTFPRLSALSARLPWPSQVVPPVARNLRVFTAIRPYPAVNVKLTRFSSNLPHHQGGFTIRKTTMTALVVLGLVGLASGVYASKQNSIETTSPRDLIQVMHSQVSDTLKHSQEVPGLKSADFEAIRDEVGKKWDILVKDGVLEVSGTDKDVRPYFVTLQGVIEHVLASQAGQTVKNLKGFIHTPMPATPLCTTGEISKELVDPSIAVDPARLFTVKARTTIIRDYLVKGDLYVVYPKDGFAKRTESQQKIYLQELVNHQGHLFDVRLNTIEIPTDLIGATYVFQDQTGETFVFAIKMTQAKDPQETGHFGLWFGSINHPSIQGRVQAVANYMEQNGSNKLKLCLQ